MLTATAEPQHLRNAAHKDWVASGPRVLRQLQSLSRPVGPREAQKPGEQSNKDVLMKAYEAKEMAPHYDGHGSQIQRTQPILLFATITKHDVDS